MRRLEDLALAENELAAIREASDRLREVLPVEQVVLYGSLSRGERHAESDVDLLVLTTRRTSHSERHAACDAVFPVELAHAVVLSLLIVAAEDWRSGLHSLLPIHDEVEQQGVRVAA